MGNSWAIILAAGSSRRMGSQKFLLPFDQNTIIETVIDNVIASAIDHVMVVLGPMHEGILKVIGKRPVQCCPTRNMKKVCCLLSFAVSEPFLPMHFQP